MATSPPTRQSRRRSGAMKRLNVVLSASPAWVLKNLNWSERLAGIGVEQQDNREVGGNAGTSVARVKADELQAHRLLGHGGHYPEVALACLDREHVAHGLNDPAGR